MALTLWMTAARARELGCTHHARIFGLIPGFWSDEQSLWVSRSDLLNPVEDALAWLWMLTRAMRGEEPDFMLAVGREIAKEGE
jgi:hypothetical protein